MSANIFQTLFDVSVPDKVNGINNINNLIGGVDENNPLPKENAAPSDPPAPSDSNVKPAPSDSNVKPAPSAPPDSNVKPAPSAPPASNEKPAPSNSNEKPIPLDPSAPLENKNQANPNANKDLPSKTEPEIKVPVIPEKVCETNQILKRAIIIIFVFTLATYLAAITLTIRPILEFVMGPNIDLNINNNDDYIKKWFSIAKLILMYIAFIIAYVIGIILVIACIVAIFILFTGSDTVFEDTLIYMLFYFWQFETESTIWYIYAVLFAIILISVCVFLYYHLHIKSYLQNLSYPNMAESGKPEFPTPTKFIFYFGLYLSMLYLLYMLILNNALPGGSFLYTYIIMGTFMLFLCIIYKHTLNRGYIEIPIATWFIFALTVFLYAVLWEVISQLNMTIWLWLILAALVITSFILISTLVIIVILGFQENSPLNRERLELLIGPISVLIMINVIGLFIFLFVLMKDKIEK